MTHNYDDLKFEIEKLTLQPGDILRVKVIPALPAPDQAVQMAKQIKAMLPEGAQAMLYGADEAEISVGWHADTVPFRKADIRAYLDLCITRWRGNLKKAIRNNSQHACDMAECYIDAFQSVRVSLFGETLK